MNTKKPNKADFFTVTLEDGVYLRPVEATDAQAIFKAIDKSRKHLSQWLPWVEQNKCVNDSHHFLLNAERDYKKGITLHLGVFRKTKDDQETCLGMVAFREIKTFQRCGVIGFWVSVDDAQGSALCTHACSALLEYGKTFGLRKFEIHCDRSDKESLAVATRLKFRETPEIKGDDCTDQDQYVCYSLESHPSVWLNLGRHKFLSLVFLLLGLAIAVSIGWGGILTNTPGEAPAPTMRGRHLLLVGGGNNYTIQGFWYQKAREMGIELSVADRAHHFAEQVATTSMVYSFHPINPFADEKDLTKQLVNVLKHSGIEFSGVLSFSDRYLIPAALAAEELGLPTPVGPDVFRTIRDKGAMREAIGSKVPFARVSSIDDLAKAAELVGFPCVLKPSFGEDSLAVLQVPTLEKLYESYKSVTASLPRLKKIFGGEPDFLIERQLIGTEHDVNIIVENGRLLFASIHNEHSKTPPWFQETRSTVPTKLDAASQKSVIAFVQNLLRKSGITAGVIHLEFIYTEHGPELLEVNGRLGCKLETHSIEVIYGVDHVKLAYTLAAGLPLPPLSTSGVLGDDKPPLVAISIYPEAPFTGYVKDTGYMQQLQKDPRIKHAQRVVNVGEKVYGPDADRPWILGMFMMVEKGPIEKVEREAESLYQSVDWGSYLSKTDPGLALEVPKNNPIVDEERCS